MVGWSSAFKAFSIFLSRPFSPDRSSETGIVTFSVFTPCSLTAALAAPVDSKLEARSTFVAVLLKVWRVESPSNQSRLPGPSVKDAARAAGAHSAPAASETASTVFDDFMSEPELVHQPAGDDGLPSDRVRRADGADFVRLLADREGAEALEVDDGIVE